MGKPHSPVSTSSTGNVKLPWSTRSVAAPAETVAPRTRPRVSADAPTTLLRIRRNRQRGRRLPEFRMLSPHPGDVTRTTSRPAACGFVRVATFIGSFRCQVAGGYTYFLWVVGVSRWWHDARARGRPLGAYQAGRPTGGGGRVQQRCVHSTAANAGL